MKNTINIAVLGGTGKSGKYLVDQLIKLGYHFKLLVRNPDSFTIQNPCVKVVHGDVNDFDTVVTLLKGCDAVISTIGIGVPQSAHTIFRTSSHNIVKAMKQLGLQRYIVITGLNVNTELDKKSPKTQIATNWMYENYPESTINKQEEYEFLLESDIDFTLIRLPTILLNDDKNSIKWSLEDCRGSGIGATDLAQFLINQLTDSTFIRKAPFIWST